MKKVSEILFKRWNQQRSVDTQLLTLPPCLWCRFVSTLSRMVVIFAKNTM